VFWSRTYSAAWSQGELAVALFLHLLLLHLHLHLHLCCFCALHLHLILCLAAFAACGVLRLSRFCVVSRTPCKLATTKAAAGVCSRLFLLI